MDILAIICFLLIGLNVFQFWHWSRVSGRLIDKMMSKNYAEYVQATNLANPSPGNSQPPPELPTDDEELKRLNQMIGVF